VNSDKVCSNGLKGGKAIRKYKILLKNLEAPNANCSLISSTDALK
jgi:hypothetical protein